jgi:hypothetical protein
MSKNIFGITVEDDKTLIQASVIADQLAKICLSDDNSKKLYPSLIEQTEIDGGSLAKDTKQFIDDTQSVVSEITKAFQRSLIQSKKAGKITDKMAAQVIFVDPSTSVTPFDGTTDGKEHYEDLKIQFEHQKLDQDMLVGQLKRSMKGIARKWLIKTYLEHPKADSETFLTLFMERFHSPRYAQNKRQELGDTKMKEGQSLRDFYTQVATNVYRLSPEIEPNTIKKTIRQKVFDKLTPTARVYYNVTKTGVPEKDETPEKAEARFQEYITSYDDTYYDMQQSSQNSLTKIHVNTIAENAEDEKEYRSQAALLAINKKMAQLELNLISQQAYTPRGGFRGGFGSQFRGQRPFRGAYNNNNTTVTRDKSQIQCHKCSKFGHYANECYSNQTSYQSTPGFQQYRGQQRGQFGGQYRGQTRGYMGRGQYNNNRGQSYNSYGNGRQNNYNQNNTSNWTQQQSQPYRGGQRGQPWTPRGGFAQRQGGWTPRGRGGTNTINSKQQNWDTTATAPQENW